MVLLASAFVPLAFGEPFALSVLLFGVSPGRVRPGDGSGARLLRAPAPRCSRSGLYGRRIIVLIVVAVVVLVYSALNVPVADNSIEDVARESGAEALLWAIPFAWLAIGLGEELVFRGTIQNSLEGEFSTRSATLATSVIFALVHVPAYYAPNPAALKSVLTVLFCLSLILGTVYVRRP